MQYIGDIPVWGEHEPNTIEQAKVCTRNADYFALMADGHLGYGVPIGGVIASESRISPTAVGFDIACGNKAVRLDIPGAEQGRRYGPRAGLNAALRQGRRRLVDRTGR